MPRGRPRRLESTTGRRTASDRRCRFPSGSLRSPSGCRRSPCGSRRPSSHGRRSTRAAPHTRQAAPADRRQSLRELSVRRRVGRGPDPARRATHRHLPGEPARAVRARSAPDVRLTSLNESSSCDPVSSPDATTRTATLKGNAPARSSIRAAVMSGACLDRDPHGRRDVWRLLARVACLGCTRTGFRSAAPGRLAGRRERPSIPGVCEEGATQPAGMPRPEGSPWAAETATTPSPRARSSQP